MRISTPKQRMEGDRLCLRYRMGMLRLLSSSLQRVQILISRTTADARLYTLHLQVGILTVSYTHLRAHETDSYLVCRLLLEKKKYAVFCLKKKNSFFFFFFLMIRRQPRSTHCISSAASDVYKRQEQQFKHSLLTMISK